ncbi:hypothetical protein GGR56DRAFT_33935 [Xylariaceae sp. FL0804]|nr:hypothetical protein GGR56DRAFT_33935 [Xylariaceae sp. FL0804]
MSCGPSSGAASGWMWISPRAWQPRRSALPIPGRWGEHKSYTEGREDASDTRRRSEKGGGKAIGRPAVSSSCTTIGAWDGVPLRDELDVVSGALLSDLLSLGGRRGDCPSKFGLSLGSAFKGDLDSAFCSGCPEYPDWADCSESWTSVRCSPAGLTSLPRYFLKRRRRSTSLTSPIVRERVVGCRRIMASREVVAGQTNVSSVDNAIYRKRQTA